MIGNLRREVVENFVIVGGLIGMQFVYAGNAALQGYLMTLGLNPTTIIIFSTSATFLLLSPLSFHFERSKWPKKFSLKFMIQLLLISFAGVTLFQALFLRGIKLTSPAMATAMPNLAPGLIFIIAAAVRLERLDISCMYSKVKVLGTFLCVMGAVTLSIMHSTTTRVDDGDQPSTVISGNVLDPKRLLGCGYLIAAVIVLSSNVVLQAATLGDFPAPISLCAITSLIGVIITAIVEVAQHHQFIIASPLVSTRDIIGYSLLGGAISGICVSFNGWAMRKRGPVLVSMFSPVATVVSVIMTFIMKGDCISTGSLVGMLLMFSGLYFFLWAKGKEGFLVGDGDVDVDDLECEYDVGRPLLSEFY